MAEVGSLRIEIEALTARFDRAMDEANRRLERLGRQSGRTEREVSRFGRGMDRITNTLRSATRAFSLFGASLTVGGLVALTRQTLSFADEIGKAADRVGVTTDELQELRVAAELSGVASRSLDVAMQRFSRRVGDAATGSGKLAKTLADQGIALRNTDGSMRSNVDILGDYADAIQRADSEQEKLLLAFIAFDREGAALVNALRNGKEGLDELRASAVEAGLVLEENLIRQAERINDRWTLLSRRFQTEIGSRILEALEFVAERGRGAMATLFSFIGIEIARAKRDFEVFKNVVVALFQEAAALAALPFAKLFEFLSERLRAFAVEATVFGIELDFTAFAQFADAIDSATADLPRLGDAWESARVESEKANKEFLRAKELLDNAAVAAIKLEGAQNAALRAAQRAREGVGGLDAPGAVETSTGTARASEAEKQAKRELERIARQIEAETRKLQARADAITAGTRSAEATLTAELRALEDLRRQADAGRIIFDTETGGAMDRARDAIFERYRETVEKLNGETRSFIDTWRLAEGDLDKIASRAGASIRDNFQTFLFDPFEVGLGGLLESFTATLRRMAVEAATARIFDAIAGSSFGAAISGIFGDVVRGVGGAQGGPRMRGGPVTAGVPYLVGERGPELFVPANAGRVEPRLSSPQVNVTIENRGTPQQVERSRAEFDGEKLVVQMITRDVSRRGPVAAALEGAYGLQRGR